MSSKWVKVLNESFKIRKGKEEFFWTRIETFRSRNIESDEYREYRELYFRNRIDWSPRWPCLVVINLGSIPFLWARVFFSLPPIGVKFFSFRFFRSLILILSYFCDRSIIPFNSCHKIVPSSFFWSGNRMHPNHLRIKSFSIRIR